MRKVIGIGETILDILFRDGQPQAAVPGGSVYNAVISLGRMGQNVTFISETGNDRVGEMILANMRENGVDTANVNVFPEGKSPVSLAFLNERNDAEYIFYKDYPRQRLEVNMPEISSDDIIMIGSYFAITPVLRDKVKELLDRAHDAGAIIYYDVNFRSTHANEAIKLMPTIIENFEYADILRGSTEDFQNMFRQPDADKVYSNHVGFYCPNFICTDADGDVRLRTKHVCKDYPVTPLKAVSTIGAGDNFNAGVVYGLLKYRVRRADLAELTEADWDAIIRCGMDLASEVCQSYDNYISKEFAAKYVSQS
jgi:fructokinase